MGAMLLIGAGIAALAAAKAFSKKETQSTVASGSSPGVRVVTPVSNQVTRAQRTATVARPPQTTRPVTVARPPVASHPTPAAPASPLSRFFTDNPNQTSVVPPKVAQPANPYAALQQHMTARRPIAATTTSAGIVYSPPDAVQPNQPLPVVITPTGKAPIGLASVKDVQNALNTLGYAKLVADGVLGRLTIDAIRKFQSANGLTVDGNAGPATKAALSAALAALAAGSNAAVGVAVTNVTPATAPNLSNKDIQKYLNLLGANPKLVEDGALGPKSVSAIKSFQVSHGLTPDGIAGPKTKAALVLAAKA